MLTYIAAALTIGILGNLHCVGMCGPIALAIPVNHTSPWIKSIKILVYNGGRILTYGVLGLLFGLFGKGVAIAGYQQGLSIVSGILILLLFFIPGFTAKFQRYGFVNGLKSRMIAYLQKKNISALFVFGLLNGLLPCGLVYIAIFSSIATMDPINGSMFMIFFGVATIPSMFIMSYSATLLKGRSLFRKVSSALVVMVGITLILRGMNLGIPYLSPALSTPFVKSDCCGK